MEIVIQELTKLYQKLTLARVATEEDVYAIGVGVGLLMAIILFFIFRKKRSAPIGEQATLGAEVSQTLDSSLIPEAKSVSVVGLPWQLRLKKGLERSRSEIWGKMGQLFSGHALDDDTLDEIEELLYGADLGPSIVGELSTELKKKARLEGFGKEQFKFFLRDFLSEKMGPIQRGLETSLFHHNPESAGGTKVIMIVGVNGAGKTTTIGKLATKLTAQGASVVVGAGDTFRAAAVDQLEVWCQRAGATMIRAKEGAAPSGVGHEALQLALAQKADYCILDTAGRLHTAGNLMQELKKSKEVLKKLNASAPHQILLVIDAITGQNAIRQAEEFDKFLQLTGLIFTKCDGSSKAGSAVSIVQKLNLPIAYIGVGENVEDLNVFNLDEYLNALLDFE